MKVVGFLFLCISLSSALAQQDAWNRAIANEGGGRLQEAYNAYKDAGDIYYNDDDFVNYSKCHLKMADCQLQLGDPFHSKSLAENTLEFIEKEISDETQLMASSKTIIGLSHLNLGRNDDAIESLLEAENQFGSEETLAKARCFDALGLAYWNNENKSLAIQYHEQALSIRRKLLGIKSIEVGNSFNNLGLVYLKEDPLQALIYFNRAKAIYEELLGNADRRTLRVITNMAFANVGQDNFDEAFDLLNSVQSIYETQYPGEHPNKAFILSSLGRVHLEKGDSDQALLFQNQALQMYISLFGEKHPEVANTYFLIGEIYKAKTEFKLSVEFYQRSIFANLPDQSPIDNYDLPELKNFFNADILLTSLQAKAIALEALHYEKTLNVKDLVGAVDTYIKCDELITIIRRKRLNEQDKLKLGQIAKEVYESGIQLALTLSEQSFSRKKYLQRAFEFCERSKSSVLLEAITESKAKEFAGIPGELLILEDSLKDEISYLELRLASAEASEEQQIKELLFSYQNSYREFISELESNYPDYYNLKYSEKIAGIEDVQKKLNDQSALISYFNGENDLYIFVISNKKAYAERKRKNDNFDKLPTALRNAIRYNIESAFVKTSKELYEQLIPKLPSSTTEIVILPDGALGTIPFEAFIVPDKDVNLYSSATYLLNKYHVSYDYSATIFTQRSMADNLRSPEILLMAPVNFENNEVQMSSLPDSENEIKEIKYLFLGSNSNPTVQSGLQASEWNFKQEDLTKYHYLHFATHGIVNESEPALSRIFLAPGLGQDGSLYTGEIYNLKINADLVTLSACETGLGKVTKGEGIVGLSRALQYAGANNIIVSLWQVADSSTAQMMIEFYRYNLNNEHHGYNAALRQAKLSLLNSDEFSRPYYWAPFILVGI